MEGVKRSTAISRLIDVCDGFDRAKEWSEPTVSAVYVYGPLLEGEDDLEWVSIAIAVDEPAERVPWMSRPAHLEALAKLLRLDRLPISWRWRPVEWPIWNHHIARAACLWTAADGRDEAVLAALRRRDASAVNLAQPTDIDAARQQVEIERDTARAHLAHVTAMYHDREWRRDHKGDGLYPEDTLWAAAAAFIELDDWLADSDSRP
jgi:hypothetical protein